MRGPPHHAALEHSGFTWFLEGGLRQQQQCGKAAAAVAGVPALLTRAGEFPSARLPVHVHLPRLPSVCLLQKLHKGVIRDEELYRIKKQQLLAGQLIPAQVQVAQAAATTAQQ